MNLFPHHISNGGGTSGMNGGGGGHATDYNSNLLGKY